MVKQITDYINKNVRKLKYRKGFGVHSPFAFSLITETIEEKVPYYSYAFLQKLYDKNSPVPFKLATLMLRLSNRFHARNILEIGSDGGKLILPIVLTDSRNSIFSVTDEMTERAAKSYLSVLKVRQNQVSFKRTLSEVPDNLIADFVILSCLPEGYDTQMLFEYLKTHTHEQSVFFIKEIRPKKKMEKIWDIFCDDENVQITMDLYENGLAIRRPRFFKQHYRVSF